MKILITGASGFLGHRIARHSIEAGHDVLMLSHGREIRRPIAGGTYVFTSEGAYEETIAEWQPDVLIHAAWGGVAAVGRSDADVQAANVSMSEAVFNLYPYRQIIALGSQDEYGYIDHLIDETQRVQPLSPYGKAKVRCKNLLQTLSEKRGASWQWLRIFSVYGEGQDDTWLIPSIARRCLNGTEAMDTTEGRQRYAYLYVGDLADAVVSTIGRDDKSGVYNLSAEKPVALSDLFEEIKRLSDSDITFRPVLPYRENQSMMVCGNSQKFIDAFGSFEKTSLEEGLRRTIHYIKETTATAQ